MELSQLLSFMGEMVHFSSLVWTLHFHLFIILISVLLGLSKLHLNFSKLWVAIGL